MMPADCKPACTDPELLPLVDLTFERGKKANAAARELVKVACSRCPVPEACLHEFGRNAHGVWGGTRRKSVNGNLTGGSTIKVVAA